MVVSNVAVYNQLSAIHAFLSSLFLTSSPSDWYFITLPSVTSDRKKQGRVQHVHNHCTEINCVIERNERPPVSQNSVRELQRTDKEKRKTRVGFTQYLASTIIVATKVKFSHYSVKTVMYSEHVKIFFFVTIVSIRFNTDIKLAGPADQQPVRQELYASWYLN